MNTRRHLIKYHADIMTVPETIKIIREEYANLGYKTIEPLFNTFSYWLDDGTKIDIYWECGAFYEEVR